MSPQTNAHLDLAMVAWLIATDGVTSCRFPSLMVFLPVICPLRFPSVIVPFVRFVSVMFSPVPLFSPRHLLCFPLSEVVSLFALLHLFEMLLIQTLNVSDLIQSNSESYSLAKCLRVSARRVSSQ